MRQTQNTKKDNRKSIFVIALLLLLVAVIGFGGYTMSKYISSKNKEGSASVAKWGYTITADTTKLFGDEYVAGVIGDATAEGAVITAKADTTNRFIVAPGHSGSMTFTVKGTAEVKAKISLSFVNTPDEIVLNYTKSGAAEVKNYYPVKWTLTKKNKDGDSTTIAEGKLSEIEEKLKGADYTGTTYDAGADVEDVYTLSWSWAFENTDDDANSLDTLLGWTASGATVPDDYGFAVAAGTSTDIAFALNISVEQLAQ